MASSSVTGESTPVITLPNHFAPMPAVMRTLAQFDRPSLECFISVAISLLDAVDGDPEVELNGDELDGNTQAEDSFQPCFNSDRTVGCPISDPDSAVDDSPCDDLFMDMEEESPVCFHYRIDQSKIDAFGGLVPVFQDTIL